MQPLYYLIFINSINKGVLLILLLSLTACINKGEREAHYMRLGQTQLEQNQLDQAAEQFNHALQINAANTEAYYQLGLIQEKREQYRTALTFFTQALERNPDHAQAQARLAQMHLKLGQSSQAKVKATAMLKADPTNEAAKTIMAEVSAGQGNVGGAIKDLEKAKKTSIHTLDYYQQLASLYLRQGQLVKAQNILQEALKYYAQNIELQLSLAQTYMQEGKLERAEAPLQAVATLAPMDFSHHARLASHYVTRGDKQKAEATLRTSITAAPNEHKRIMALAEFLLRHRSPEAAEAALQGFIQQQPSSYALRFALADLYENTALQGKAEKTYQALIEQDVSAAVNEKAHTKLAQMYAGMGKPSLAHGHIEKALAISSDSTDVLVARGKLAMEEGDYDRATADFRSALKAHPRSVEYMHLLARTYVQIKQPALARDLLFRAVKNNPDNVSIHALFAEHLIEMRDDAAASEEISVMAAKFPFDPVVQNLRQRVATRQSAAVAVQPEHALPAHAAAYNRQARHYLDEKNYDQAASEFQKALHIAPSAIEPLKGLVQTRLAQGRPDLALAWVSTQLRITSPTVHQAYYLLGQIHEAQKLPAEALRAYQKALDINANWDAPYFAVARHHHAHGDNVRALGTLETARRNLPDNEAINLHFIAMLEANQQYDRAISEYEKRLRAEPDLEIAVNNLAVLLLDKRGDKASVERALNLTRRFQTSAQPAYLDTLGWALFKSGQASRSLPYLEKAHAAEPDVPGIHYHLGLAYQATGDKDKAKTHLLQAIGSGAAFSGREQAKLVAAKL